MPKTPLGYFLHFYYILNLDFEKSFLLQGLGTDAVIV